MKLLLTLCCLSCSAIGATVPEWLHGKEDLLPRVSEAAIEAMREHWAMPRSGFCGYGVDTPERSMSALKIMRMGSAAAKALTWVYAEDPPPAKFADDRTRQEKADMLRGLLKDADAAVWLVPLVRHRLAWAREKLGQARLDETWFSNGELATAETLMNIHGTPEDLQQVRQLEADLRISGTRLGRELYPASKHTLAEQQEVDQSRRDSFRQHLQPYSENYRSLLMRQNIVTDDDYRIFNATYGPNRLWPRPSKESASPPEPLLPWVVGSALLGLSVFYLRWLNRSEPYASLSEGAAAVVRQQAEPANSFGKW